MPSQLAQPSTMKVDEAKYVVLAASGFTDVAQAPSAMVDQLVAALNETGADLAIASPFARGGKLRGLSWLSRTATYWINAFLSLAAHGEVATVVGTIRVYRREAFQRLIAACPGIDLDSELVFEARRQGMRIVELPAVLEFRRTDPFSMGGLLKAAARGWAQLRTGLRYRPALWLALPGLVPGLLPLVVAVLLIARATPAEAAFWTALTLIVQYGSLAIFSWQTSRFVATRWLRRKSS